MVPPTCSARNPYTNQQVSKQRPLRGKHSIQSAANSAPSKSVSKQARQCACSAQCSCIHYVAYRLCTLMYVQCAHMHVHVAQAHAFAIVHAARTSTCMQSARIHLHATCVRSHVIAAHAHPCACSARTSTCMHAHAHPHACSVRMHPRACSAHQMLLPATQTEPCTQKTFSTLLLCILSFSCYLLLTTCFFTFQFHFLAFAQHRAAATM